MSTIVLCSGPSCTDEVIALAREQHERGAWVIVTNRTFRWAPWADTCFGMDASWWKDNAPDVAAAGMEMVSTSDYAQHYGARHVRKTPLSEGLSEHGITGRNTGHCAVSFAWLNTPPTDIIAVAGWDMQHVNGKSHHHGGHPLRKDGTRAGNAHNCGTWHEHAKTLASDHRRLGGAMIVNCSPYSSTWLDLPHLSFREFVAIHGLR